MTPVNWRKHGYYHDAFRNSCSGNWKLTSPLNMTPFPGINWETIATGVILQVNLTFKMSLGNQRKDMFLQHFLDIFLHSGFSPFFLGGTSWVGGGKLENLRETLGAFKCHPSCFSNNWGMSKTVEIRFNLDSVDRRNFHKFLEMGWCFFNIHKVHMIYVSPGGCRK